jgi:LmbE family N-acetylglucosaminyl deacetylase
VAEVWLGASPRADHAVDVTDVVDQKWAALLSHVTQVSHQPEGRLKEFVGAWMARTARTHGLPEGRLAEAFHVVHTA